MGNTVSGIWPDGDVSAEAVRGRFPRSIAPGFALAACTCLPLLESRFDTDIDRVHPRERWARRRSCPESYKNGVPSCSRIFCHRSTVNSASRGRFSCGQIAVAVARASGDL